ncbi:MAG: glutathione transferase GstA [Archangium sp.]
MKLYFVPGVCSMASHIVLREGKFDFQLDRVDVRNNKKTDGGEDYVALNPKGYVPALKLDNGRVLTEGAVIMQYLADQKPETKLAPANGTMERLELQEWLHFIATELHKGMSVFYQASAGEELRGIMRGRLDARFGLLSKHLATHEFIMGDQFTVADAYAFYVLRAFQKQVKATLEGTLAKYYASLAQRPSVKAALEFEKLEP